MKTSIFVLCSRLAVLSILACFSAKAGNNLQDQSSVDSSGINNLVFKSDYKINPDKKGELLFQLDNINFFKDNEYSTSLMKGYSLPGLWVQPKLVYYPLKNIKLELGAHLLRYWGANKYPNMAYQDIANWKGDQYQKGFHVYLLFRAQVALSKHVNIVLGTLYGGANHNLIEPLYSPELNLTADPETGLQLLYNSRLLDLDIWVNWESFIFREDVHQEAFTVGLSTRFKLNRPESRFHFYIPIQGLAQHRGGEIDTLFTNSVQTLMNGAAGVGAVWNINHPVFKNVNVELDGTGYYQQAGELWPFNSGAGLYARASADIYDFRVKTSYFACHNFISMFGLPFYGAVSTKEKDVTYENPKMLYWGIEYAHSFGKGFSLGIDLDIYRRLFCNKIGGEYEYPKDDGPSTSFSAGIYLRINPSFLLKKF
ncbi:hypothetical protein [Parabacteroides chinchillae]|uniref:Surface antigen n=1 Tax=Parabacteroides chinchillae TaxID=871327 RepID=A0A8G2BYU5_9BACT|nr:hypothetical protein [Parabacteroides chinchillae]SEG24391.1 hypothetical protein SAMN05444001_12328 [Parabacteroides chinchillae]